MYMLSRLIIEFGANAWNPRGKYRLYKILAKIVGNVAGKTPFGVTLDFRIDDLMAYYYFRRDYQPHLRQLIDGLPPGGVFVDVGANIGNYSVLASRRCAEAGLVIAFEPVAETYLQLKKHIELNNAMGIVPINAAVGAVPGMGEMVACEDSGLSFIRPPSSGRSSQLQPTRIVSLDECLPPLIGLREIDLMKIDVEGAELGVVKGADRLLRSGKIKTLIIEIVPEYLARFDSTPEQLWDYMTARGYNPRYRRSGCALYDEIFDRK
jgi:FkbM family methyltransferase